MPNPYIATLNKFRKAMKRVRSKRFCETLSFAARASRSYGYTDSRPSSMHSIMALPDATDDIIEPSVAALLGNPDYFAPLLAPLKHLSIDEGWRLDGMLRGSSFASVFDLLVTDDNGRTLTRQMSGVPGMFSNSCFGVAEAPGLAATEQGAEGVGNG